MRNPTLRGLARSGVFAGLLVLAAAAVARDAGQPTDAAWLVLNPARLPPAQPSFDAASGQWTVTGELFNPGSGFYSVVAQKMLGPNNPPCTGCAPDLGFVSTVSDPAPLPGVPANLYGRVSWHTLEPTEGHYDLSVIDHALAPCPPPPPGQAPQSSQPAAACLPPGATFGFRVMALNPQYRSDTSVTTDDAGNPIYSDSPAYLLRDEAGNTHGWLLPLDPNDLKQGSYFIPDWNDAFVIARMQALLAALGARYDADPRIGTIDIGLYGSWGEWHTSGLPDKTDYAGGNIPYAATSQYYSINTQAYQHNHGTHSGAYEAGSTAARQSIIEAHANAFPHKQLVMLTDNAESLCAALRIDSGNLPIGLRRDSLGSYGAWNWQFPPSPACISPDGHDLVAERWQRAPFVTEPFGNGSSSAAACQSFTTVPPELRQFAMLEQVRDYHVAAVKNGAFCAGNWAALSQDQQRVVWQAGLAAGYRYAPASIALAQLRADPAHPALALRTQWSNAGLAPTYLDWQVEFALRPADLAPGAPLPAANRFVSGIDLRRVLPGNRAYFADRFALPAHLAPGTYALELRVIDPRQYLKPMQLALREPGLDGYYRLGEVRIAPLPPTARVTAHAGAPGR